MKLKLKILSVLLCLSMMVFVLSGIGPLKGIIINAQAIEMINANCLDTSHGNRCEKYGSCGDCCLQQNEPANDNLLVGKMSNEDDYLFLEIQHLSSESVKGAIDIMPNPAPMTTVEPWALGNLILIVAGMILVLMVGIHTPMKKRENPAYDGSEHNGSPLMLAVSVQAVMGIILFVLTEDMSRYMLIVNDWTFTHVILLSSGILCYILIGKKDNAHIRSNKV